MAMSSATEVVAIAVWMPSRCLSLFTGRSLAQLFVGGVRGRSLLSPLPEGEEAGWGALGRAARWLRSHGSRERERPFDSAGAALKEQRRVGASALAAVGREQGT